MVEFKKIPSLVEDAVQDESLNRTLAEKKAKYLKGIVVFSLICGKLFEQVGLGEVMQYVSCSGIMDRPFFTIWSNHNGLMLLIPVAIWYRKEGWRLIEEQGLTFWTFFGHSFHLSFHYLVLNFLWAAGMTHISVGSSLAVRQSGPVFVYIFSYMFLKETITTAKVASVAVSMLGVFLFFVEAYEDSPAEGSSTDQSCGESEGASDTVVGLVLLLLFTMYYSAYSILWKKTVDSKDISIVSIYLSAISLHNFLFLWVILLIPSFAHVEAMEIPSWTAVPWIFVLMCVATIGNFSVMFGYSVTSPLYFSVGMVFSIPMAMLVDNIREGHNTVTFLGGVGTLLITLGFLIMLLDKPAENTEDKIQKHMPIPMEDVDLEDKNTHSSNCADEAEDISEEEARLVVGEESW